MKAVDALPDARASRHPHRRAAERQAVELVWTVYGALATVLRHDVLAARREVGDRCDRGKRRDARVAALPGPVHLLLHVVHGQNVLQEAAGGRRFDPPCGP